MTSAWMVASTVVAMLLACSAFVIARVVALYRGAPLRWVWLMAMVTSMALPLLWLRPLPSATATRTGVGLPAQAPAASGPRVRTTLEPAPASRMRSVMIPLPHIPPAPERVVMQAWFTVSMAFLTLLAVTATRLYLERRVWQWHNVANTQVLLAPTFGPAIVGVRHPDIVLPEWVLALDDASQRTIVAHEEEHRAARDQILLLVGLAAVVLVPWNIGLWMSWRGLRRAIELDCDARVVGQGIADTEYASVLLSAWHSTHGSWLPSTAFAERASGLGARVEHLMRPEPRRRAMRTAIGGVMAATLVFFACTTVSPRRASSDLRAPYPLVIIDGVPKPDLPPRFRYTGPIAAETTTTPTYRIVYRGSMVADTAARKFYPAPGEIAMMQTIDAPGSVVHFGEKAMFGAQLYYTKKYREAGGAVIAPTEGSSSSRRADPATSQAEMSRRIYDDLFNGISLSPGRGVQALQIIDAEGAQQRAVRGPVLVSWPRRIELNAIRHSELRALLTSDADRARFDVRSLESRPRSLTVEGVAQSMYNNLFRDPTTSSDTKLRAMAIITAALNEDAAVYRAAPKDFDARMAIRLARDAALRTLLTTEAGKEQFDNIAVRTRGGELKRP